MGKKDRVKIDGCQVTLKHFGLICYEESFYEALDWCFCSLTFSSISFAWTHLRYYSHPFHSPWPLNVDGSWRTSLWDSPFLLVLAWQRQPPVFTSHFAVWAFYELTSHAWPPCQATCWLQLSCQTVLQHLKLRWAQIRLISLSLVLLSFWFPWKAPSFFWCLKCKTNNFESRFPLPPFRSAQLSAPWGFLSGSITSCTDALVSLFTAYASPVLDPLVSLSLWVCHICAGGAAVT